MNNKYMRLFALVLGLLMAASVAMSACTSDECTSHVDANADSLCDVCGKAMSSESEDSTDGTTEEITTEAAKADVEVTLTVGDQRGNILSGVVLSIQGENNFVAAATTDESGKATVTLKEGHYIIQYETLPEYVLGGGDTLDVAVGMEPVTLQVTNNTPDGTKDYPFFINEDSTTVTIPAGGMYYYSMFAGDRRSLVIENAAVEVTFRDVAYTPDENGLVKVALVADNQRDHIFFTVKNTAESEAAITLTIESEPGSTDNPIELTALDESIVSEVPKGSIMYYTYTVTGDITGLKVKSTDKTNNISLTNRTTSAATNFTNGAEAGETLTVKAGDVIVVAVSSLSNDNTVAFNTVTFSLVGSVTEETTA